MTGRRRTSGLVAACLAVAVVACVCVAALAALASLAPRSLEPLVVDRFEHATGRRLTIAGRFAIALLPTPAIEADDVSVSNPPGFPATPMLRVRRLRAGIDLLPLLAGRVRLTDLSLEDPRLALERRADGVANWVLAPERRAAPAAAPAAHGTRVGFELGAIDATGGAVAWRDLDRAASPRLGSGAFAIDRLHAGHPGARNPLTLALHGRHDGHPFFLSLSTGSPARLARADAADPFPLRAILTFGPGDADRIVATGTSTDPDRGRGIAGTVLLHLEHPDDVQALLPHAGLPAGGRIDADADLAAGPGGRLAIGRFRLETGALDLGRVRPGLALARLRARADEPGGPIAVEASGTAAGRPFALRATALGSPALWSGIASDAPLSAALDWGAARAGLAGTLARPAPGAWALRGATVSLHDLDPASLAAAAGIAPPGPVGDPRPIGLDGTLDAVRDPTGWSATLAARALSTGAAAWPAATWRFRLARDGSLDLAAASVASPHLLAATRRPDPAGAALHVAIDARDLPAGPVLALVSGERGLRGSLALRADLAGTLSGDRLVLARLSGPVDALLTDAVLDGALARALIAPIAGGSGLLPRLLGPQPVHCADLVGRFAEGALLISGFSLDTPLVTADGSGAIDLVARSLRLSLSPTLHLGPAAASAPVLVSGPLADPAVALARGAAGRFDLSLGRGAEARPAACDLRPGVGVPQRRAPRVLDLLRGLGLR